MPDPRAPNPQPPGEGEEREPRRSHDWEAFYTELIEFEERSLRSMRELSVGMTAGEREAVRLADVQPLEELIADFRRRLEIWRSRVAPDEPERREC